MQKLRVTALIITLMFAVSNMVSAFSVGPINVRSYSGENFQAEIPVELQGEESLKNLSVSIGSAQDYQLLNSQRTEVITDLKTSMVPDKRGARILIQSDKVINLKSFEVVINATMNQGTILKKFLVSLLTRSEPIKGSDVARESAMVKKIASLSRSPKTYGPVLQGENLLLIVKKLSLSGYEPEIVAVALWQKNQSAFIGGNIHGLKADTLLHLEDLSSEMAKLDISEARRVITSQWEEWVASKPKGTRTQEVAKKPESAQGVISKSAGVVQVKTIPESSRASAQTAVRTAQTGDMTQKQLVEPKAMVSEVDKTKQADALGKTGSNTRALATGKDSPTISSKLNAKEKARHETQDVARTEQPSGGSADAIPPGMAAGSIMDNLEKTVESLRGQLDKLRKELLMVKSRLFEMESQSQNLRQYLIYLLYFTASENILLAALVIYFYIRRRKSGGKPGTVFESDTLWMKK